MSFKSYSTIEVRRTAWAVQEELSQSEDILEMEDIKFKVKGKILQASKTALRICSPVFKTMFRQDFKERDAKVIDLPEKDYKGMFKFLEVIHSSDEVNADNVFDIVPICHEYQCIRLLKQCDQVMSCTPEFLKCSNVEEVVNKLSMASQFDLKETKKHFLQAARYVSLEKLKSYPKFESVSAETCAEFLKISNQVMEEDLTAIKEIFNGIACKKTHSNAWSSDRKIICDSDDLNEDACRTCKVLLFNKAKEISNKLGKVQ